MMDIKLKFENQYFISKKNTTKNIPKKNPYDDVHREEKA